jgi:hypothetical protein
VPAFHVLANLLDNGERGLDHVGTRHGLSQLQGQVQTMHGQRLFHPFSQAPRRTRVQIHQFAMQRVQRLLGRGVVFQRIGRVELRRHGRLLFLGQMVQHVPPLVDLTALDRRRLAGILFHRSSQRLAAIQNVEPRLGEIEAALHQVGKQLAHHRCVLGGALPNPQDHFPPVFIDAQRGYHLLPLERRRVHQ